jgi:hypothetical protein
MENATLPPVLWILGPLFALVGIHLLRYSQRRRQMLWRFARARRLSVAASMQPLEQCLERCFSLDREGLAR